MNQDLEKSFPKISPAIFPAARRMLVICEGVRMFPYDDKTGENVKAFGFVSIGIGRNLAANPLSGDEIGFLFSADLSRAINALLTIFPDKFEKFPPARQLALINMIFNMGPSRFRGFKKMISAIRVGDYDRAAVEILDSDWARSSLTRARAEKVSKMMRENINFYAEN